MKRKLNENDVPEAAQSATNSPISSTFADFGLDFRLLQAVSGEKYSNPTAVQSLAIPQALEGKSLIVRARTGSGKTAAYVLPILESILRKAGSEASSRGTSALILVPTKELASQVLRAITSLSFHCSKSIQAVNLTGQVHEQSQRALLASGPDIVVATPATALRHLSNSSLAAENITNFVVDEADLILSYGYEDDFKNIIKLVPRNVQTFLASATLTPEVDTLKSLLCENAVVLNLQETEDDAKSMNQYVVTCAEDEKFLLLFALFKLKLIKGKCIVFVGDVDRCYRVKLFLEQFGTRSCVLNSELPVNCRIHVVEEFNKGVYDVIIATDELEILGDEEGAKRGSMSKTDEDAERNNGEVNKSTKKDGEHAGKRQRSLQRRRDKEYGISRGIDFQQVTCVLNFDLPTSSKSYVHRIGRTARAGRSGIAMSFVVPAQEYRKHKTLSFSSTENDEITLSKISHVQDKRGQSIQPYNFDMSKLDGFRYRVSSALKAVSAGAIREARIRELRQEMLRSEKLKRHLEENPEDAKFLRHDMELKPAKVLPHMKYVPEYLLPGAGTGKSNGGEEANGLGGGFVSLRKQTDNSLRNARLKNKMRSRGKASSRRKINPLKTFRAKA